MSKNLDNYKSNYIYDAKNIKKSFFITPDNIKISYQFCEKKKKYNRPSVVLISDIGYNSNYWLCLLNKLCPVANVYAIDLPNRSSLEFLTQDLTLFLDKLNLEKVYFVGKGLGGTLALNFAALYPARVIKIAVAATSPKYFPADNWEFPISPEIIQLFTEFFEVTNPKIIIELAKIINNLTDPVNCDKQKLLVQQYINMRKEYQTYFGAANIDIRDILNQITVPVLILAGTEDPIVPFGASEFLRNNIPNSLLIEFFGQGNNFAILDTSLFNKDIFNFFFVECDPCCAFFDSIKKKSKKCCHDYQNEEYDSDDSDDNNDNVLNDNIDTQCHCTEPGNHKCICIDCKCGEPKKAEDKKCCGKPNNNTERCRRKEPGNHECICVDCKCVELKKEKCRCMEPGNNKCTCIDCKCVGCDCKSVAKKSEETKYKPRIIIPCNYA